MISPVINYLLLLVVACYDYYTRDWIKKEYAVTY